MLTVVASSFKRYLANINLENDIAQPEATRSEKRLAVASVTQRVCLFLITSCSGANTLLNYWQIVRTEETCFSIATCYQVFSAFLR